MKKLIVCLSIALVHLSFIGSKNSKDGNFERSPHESSWVKSPKGIWLGDNQIWCKIDKKKEFVKLSRNKRRWKTSSVAVWTDKRGRWMCISNNKLMCTNRENKWLEMYNRTWQDINGKWYKLDVNLDLWEVKK